MNFLTFSRPSLIGLDAQSDGLRLAKMTKTRHGHRIECLVGTDMPEEVFVGGKIKRWDIFQARLLEITQQFHLQGLPVALGIPASLVRTQRFQLPAGMSEAVIEEEINKHVQRDLPGMADELSIDYQLEEVNKAGYIDIHVAASRREYLSQFAVCVNDCGFKVRIIDVDGYAVRRVLSNDIPSSGAHGILYFTDKNALLMVLNADEIIMQHDWEITDFHPQLQRNIEKWIVTNRMVIQRVTVCGAEKYKKMMQQESTMSWNFSLHYQQSLTHLEFAEEVDRTNMSAYLVACGLAMREVPEW